MPVHSDLDRLLVLAKEAENEPLWVAFSTYCTLRGTGEREKAFKILKAFLLETQDWDFSNRLKFTQWILEAGKALQFDKVLISQPLLTQLIVPTVREWNLRESNNAATHLWLGLLRCDDPSLHLEQALKLDPYCEYARQTLCDWILADIDYNQHEMPAFYIHDPRIDLKELDRAEQLSRWNDSYLWVNDYLEGISCRRKLAEEWLLAHPNEGDFAAY